MITIAHVLTWLSIGMLLTTCSWDYVPAQEHMKQYKSVPARKCFMNLPCPPDCSRLYDVGKHRAWADCMEVGYKPRAGA